MRRARFRGSNETSMPGPPGHNEQVNARARPGMTAKEANTALYAEVRTLYPGFTTFDAERRDKPRAIRLRSPSRSEIRRLTPVRTVAIGWRPSGEPFEGPFSGLEKRPHGNGADFYWSQARS